MSDHLENALGDLAELDTDGLGVRPESAAEVRARGDRHRRRRHALTAVAAASVVAVVGIGLDVLGGSGPSAPTPAPMPSTTAPTDDAVDEPSPSPTSPAVQLRIPDDFPLAASYPETNEDGTPVRVTRRPGVGGVSLCGETILASAGAAAVAGTKVVNPEDFRARTLLLFEDAADALALVQDAEVVVRGCPDFDFSSYTPVPVPLGETSFGFDQRYEVEQGGYDIGLQAYQVVQVGRAVLINTAYGEGNGSEETRAAFNQRLTDDAREVVAAMADTRWVRVKILSIQSSVAYGHVGNSAAVFPLQRLGHEVWPVYTVHFSNHTGYGAWRGPLLAADDVRAVITGIEERGVLGQVDAVLSGYQGGNDIGEVILDAVDRVKKANPAATYSCDPVMGNARSGCFVHPDIPVLLRDRVVPQADLITPNQFELGYLTDTQPADLESTLAAVDAARAMGPSSVLVTSVERPDAEPGTLEMLAATGDGAWLVQTPRLPIKANGSGDVTAALFTAHFRGTGDAADALARTASSVFDLLRTTHESGERELQLVESQEFYAHPRMQFEVTQVR